VRRILAALAVCAVADAAPASACELGLDGTARQGGLLVGTAPQGAAVSVAGKRVRVSASGRFLVGFGRNAPKSVEVSARLPGGKAISCTVGVAPQTYKIQKIDGLPTRQVTPDPKALARIKEDNRAIRAVRRMDTAAEDFLAGFTWPVKGRISGVYGSQRILNGKPRSPHNGVDIAAPTGTPIVAPAPGRIVLVHPDMFYTGKSVMIDHGHGLSSIYVHMSRISVKEGQRVERGQEIGHVGKTGRATGPHLHWGVSLFATHLDPMLLTGKMPK
jgi:murein DD-endopeptidase MepM/ murein hydrolase activator NlpD